MHRREDRRHGIVDPNIDWTKLVLDARRASVDCFRVGDVGRNPQVATPKACASAAASASRSAPRARRATLESRLGEFDSQRTANACPGSGYDNSPRHADSLIVR